MVLVVVLVGLAGCSAVTGGGGSTTTAGTTPGPNTPTGTVSRTASATATGTTTASGGDRSPDETATDGNTTGRMAVVVDGSRLNLGARAGSSFRVDPDAPDTWHATGSPTLSAALSTVGVDANATSLSWDGRTYRASTNGTTLVYRVNGAPVNPSDYRLRDGDEVWVLVVTNGTEAETPGEYLSEDRLHVHGTMEFVVNGTSLDFGRDEWQNDDKYFHFEGGKAEPWHAHSWSVTLAYALSTLPGVDANGHGITYDGTTYAFEGDGPTASVTVNDHPVDPTTYYLTDGDAVRIVLRPGA